MQKIEKEKLKQKLLKAEKILVGIGEEFEEPDFLEKQPCYTELGQDIRKAKMQWIMPYIHGKLLKEDTGLSNALTALGELLKDKDYFVISVCMNGKLKEAGLDPERVVEPCGSYENMQCIAGCAGSVSASDEKLLTETETYLLGKKSWDQMELPACPICGKSMVFNNLYAEHYLEEGYSPNWKNYTDWLQDTVNRELCILELGAGMLFAGIHRFRFEKIVGLNNKSSLVRIHEKLYQIPEEIADRSVGIAQNAVEFMAQMKEV